MNPIQFLIQSAGRMAPQARFARASLLDTATNPKTYVGLAESASDTLGRALPSQFRGAGFQNVPANALGALDDAAAAPFAGPVRQQILDKATKEFARKAGSGTTRVPVIPTGGQPIPAITNTGGRNPIVGPIPSRLSPRGGIPLQAGGNLLGKSLQGLGFLGAANQLRQGNVGGAIFEGSLMAPFPYLAGAAGLFAVGDGLMTPSAGDGTLDSISENLSPEQQALRDKLLKERIAAGTQKLTVGNSGLINQPPSTPEDRAYEQEKSRALQLAEQDQLAKKYQVADLTQEYNSASTPEEKQRIGLQIWATTNPQLAQSVTPRQVGYEQAQAVVKPPKDDKLDQTQKALLKQAFRRQLKK